MSQVFREWRVYPFIGALLAVIYLAGCSGQIDPSPRALDLARGLPESPLKSQLLSCSNQQFTATQFSIAHRGAPLGFPEHTLEGYRAAARMGAGLIECDVTFTKDLALVCRHSQCDLHRTTNVLATPLAAQCSHPFRPASEDQPANAQCCTSDFTVKEFKQLCGRADNVNPRATTVTDYLATPDSPVGPPISQCGTLLTHTESINAINQLGADFVPELKAPQVDMPFAGMSQPAYASKLVQEYVSAGIDPSRVHLQSFNVQDVLYWLERHPEFATQAVYLDPRGRNPNFKPSLADMQQLYAQGIRTLAPPMPMLLTQDSNGELAQSEYAKLAKQAGLSLVTWTFESRNPTSPSNWLYANLPGFMTDDSKTLLVLDALAQKVGIVGIFSDWPGTVTYYENCMAAG